MEVSLHYKYLETSKRAKQRWALAHREHINAKRRERRFKKKVLALKDKYCLNCEILLIERSKGTRIYCTTCVKDYPLEVRRHKWRRYYHSKLKRRKRVKKKPVQVEKVVVKEFIIEVKKPAKVQEYIRSWRTLKTMV